jgi:hypothetical protein
MLPLKTARFGRIFTRRSRFICGARAGGFPWRLKRVDAQKRQLTATARVRDTSAPPAESPSL